MKSQIVKIVVCMAGAFFLNGNVQADKPSWAEGGRHDRRDEGDRYQRWHKERGDERRHESRHEGGKPFRFDADSRRYIADYYGRRERFGKCPPGMLAMKHRGCRLPPGQERKWVRGRPLPADVRYYELPYDLVSYLPPPPPRYRYVQVAGDILLIAVGSSMVVDAVEDILR